MSIQANIVNNECEKSASVEIDRTLITIFKSSIDGKLVISISDLDIPDVRIWMNEELLYEEYTLTEEANAS